MYTVSDKSLREVQIAVSSAGRSVSESLNNEAAEGIHDLRLWSLRDNSSTRHDAWSIVGEVICLEFDGNIVTLYSSIYRDFFNGEIMGESE